MLTCSLERVLGPQHAYKLYLSACGIERTSQKSLTDLAVGNDSHFAAAVKGSWNPSSLQYNDNFKADWEQRWLFLTKQQGITTSDVGRHPKLLIASLEGMLRPRIAFLQLVAAQQASFCLVDHLTAVATLSDQDFAAAYDQPAAGLAYIA